jgi:hypothetical protein
MPHAVRAFALAIALGGALAGGAGEPVSLQALVGEAEFRAMGLDKLEPDEQARLARWLQLRVAGRPVPYGPPTVSFGVDTVTVTATLATPVAGAAVATPAVAPAAAPIAPYDAVEPKVVMPAAIAAAATPAPPPSAPPKATLGTVESFGLPQDEVDGGIKEVRARVVGEFTGWDGKTTFTLDNGQVWRQAVSGTYRFKATDPEVIIEKGFLGYKLRLVETRRSVPVRRIK